MTITDKLVAFHGDAAIKDKYLARVRIHRAADELIQGTGWDGHRGCAIGCTLEKYDHEAYETELGIPRSLARLEDDIFEGLPLDVALGWPERFLSAIRPGADLSLVLARWFVWMLVDPDDGVLRFASTGRARKAIQDVADLYQRKIGGEDVGSSLFRAAAAAYAADADADAAAYAAYAAYAADADAAAYAAYAAYAADAYAAAYAADAAAYAARRQCRIKQADKLIQLLEAAA